MQEEINKMYILLFLQQISEFLSGLEEILAVRVFLWGCIGFLALMILLSIYSSWEEKKRLAFYRAQIASRPSIPPQDMTSEQLSHYTGADSTKPILIAIDGTIYDVTSGASFYGPGCGYNLFAGRDATRSLAMGNFDLGNLDNPTKEGLTEDEIDTLNGWIGRFQGKYKVVGKLLD